MGNNVLFRLFTENIDRVSIPEAVESPSPPPRRPRGDKSRGHHIRYGDHDSLSDKYTGHDASDLHQAEVEKIPNTPRSPSIRKRDVMMRKYHSTSVLPIVAPVDMNKNNIMDTRDDLHFATNEHNDNDVSERIINGNQSEQDYEHDQDGHRLVQMDIVGDSYEARYPWQRDISTQCNLSGCRTSLSSGSLSSGSEWSSCYSAANNQNCTNYVNANCVNNKESAPARRQSSDNIRRRHNVFRNRRPRSMTSLDAPTMCSNYSDMYRSDTNLNYRHGRTSSDSSVLNSPSRKRMPLLLADDPGSVSDLESILENPQDG